MAELFDIGIFSVEDTDGSVGAGWKLNFYTTGTSTRQDTYPTEADADAGTNANANPVVADAAGRFAAIWLKTTGSAYKAVLTTAADAVKATKDPAMFSLTRALASTASGKGGELVGFIQPESSAVARTATAKLRERKSLLDFIPVNLHATIADRSITTSLSTYIQNALNNVPAGAELYVPYGYYPFDTAISTTRSITLTGDPGRETFDNSWDSGRGGTELHYRGTTGDGFTFLPPNATNSRVNVVLRHLTFRGSRVSHTGTSGSVIYVNGRLLSGTQVRLDIEDCHFCEAPHHGLFITGEVYGGRINNVSCHRNGYNGFRADGSVGGAGEMVLGRIRCFQNGQTAAGTQQQKANFLWLGGTVFIDMLSASESANGPGAIFGGGPINIGHLQLESNSSDDSLIIGQSGSGVLAMKIGTYMIAPDTGYTNSHIHITQYMTGRTVIGPGYHADTLGVGGLHLERDASAGELSWDVTPAMFATTIAIDDNAGSYNTNIPLFVFARDSAGLTNVTGDGTSVTWKPDTEVLDAWGAYNHATGLFTAPFTGLFEFSPQIPLSGIAAGHDRSTVTYTATSYSRNVRTGSPVAAGNATGEWKIGEPVVIPMQQGNTCSVSFSVGGGALTVDTIADPSYATFAIRSVG